MAKSEIYNAPGKKRVKRQTKLLMRVADRLREREIDPGKVGEIEIHHKPSCRATGTCNCDFDLIFPDRDESDLIFPDHDESDALRVFELTRRRTR